MIALPEGRSLELYFIDGRPDGMLTAEMFNWTGHVLMTPRTRISAALSRRESRYTGAYLLLGEQAGEPCAYIGEGEDISDRIKSHDIKKDWWTSAVLVTSAANNLNKAHVKYIEARLVEEARSAARVKLDNGNIPPLPGLSEAAKANMESFLANLLMILPALRVDLFIHDTRPAILPKHDDANAPVPRFVLDNKKRKLKATATMLDDDFIVEAGSMANAQWDGVNTRHSGYALLHEQLQKNGVLKQQDDHLVFTQNYAFKSPSAAAGVVNGRPSNGTLEWRLADGSKTYKDWEACKLNEFAPEAL
jgi:hypothetical protein